MAAVSGRRKYEYENSKADSCCRPIGDLDARSWVHFYTQRVDRIPMNPWPKDPSLKKMGRLWEANWLDGLSAFSYKLFGPEGLGWSQHELEVFLIDVRKCVRDRNVHAYQKVYVVYGRRPSEAEEKVMAADRSTKSTSAK